MSLSGRIINMCILVNYVCFDLHPPTAASLTTVCLLGAALVMTSACCSTFKQ